MMRGSIILTIGATALVAAAANTPAHLQSLSKQVGRLIDSLSPELRQKSQISFRDQERFNWHYTPRRRSGVPIADLSLRQREHLHGVLRAGLSESGYRKAAGILELEPILGELEGTAFRDPERYFFTMFGNAREEPWGWRFEGHHLSINATYGSREAALTPMFFGANPARVPRGPRAGWQVLTAEQNLGRAMLASLDADQRRRAVISARAPSDIVTGTDRRFRLDGFNGLAAAAMTSAQKEILLRLVRCYVGNAPAVTAEAEMQRMQSAGIDRLVFAWAGGDRPGQPHYYRVHGPTVLIEYDNTQDGANHIHTVWRRPGGDFGDDLLARHYGAAAHHRYATNSGR